jgi:hypothetical protein
LRVPRDGRTEPTLEVSPRWGVSPPSSGPAPGTPPYNPVWFAAGNIYWDPANLTGLASDGNDGLSAITPILTWAEAIRRYGSISPVFSYGVGVVVHKMSAQTLNVDPVWFAPKLSGGAQAVLLDTLVPFASGVTAGVVTAKNRSTPQLLTVASMPVGTTAKMFVFKSTGSYAFIDSMSGQTATMQQPLSAASFNAPATVPTPAEDNSWTTGDTLTIYNLPNLTNLKMWRPTCGDLSSGGQASAGWVQFTQIADSSGTGGSEYTLVADGINGMAGCLVVPRTHVSGLGGRGFSAYLFGNSHVGAVVIFSGAQPFIFGGGLAGGLTLNSAIMSVDGDTILHGAVIANSGTLAGDALYADGAVTIGGIGPSNFRVAVAVTGARVFWGPASLKIDANSAYWSFGPTFTANLLLSGTFTLGTNTTGTKYVAGTYTDGVALTTANMDLFGGLQDPLSGARFTLGQ